MELRYENMTVVKSKKRGAPMTKPDLYPPPCDPMHRTNYCHRADQPRAFVDVLEGELAAARRVCALEGVPLTLKLQAARAGFYEADGSYRPVEAYWVRGETRDHRNLLLFAPEFSKEETPAGLARVRSAIREWMQRATAANSLALSR